MTKLKSAITLISALTLSGCSSFDMGMLNPFSSDDEPSQESMPVDVMDKPTNTSSAAMSDTKLETMHNEWTELKPDIVKLFKLEAEVEQLKTKVANQTSMLQSQSKTIAELKSNKPTYTSSSTMTSAKGNYSIQVAAAGSRSAAEQAWRSQQRRFNQFFSSYRPEYSKIMSNGKEFYRVKVGQFSTRTMATNACNSLKAIGGQCVVRAN